MKKFILTLLYFCLPVIILSIPFDYLLSNKLKELNNFAHGENLVWNDILGGRINKDLVIYGSSRAWVHINPMLIEKKLGLTAYNLGVNGLSYRHQELRHKLFLAYNQKPKFILYSVDINTLIKQNNLYNSIQFLPYMMYNSTIYDYTINYNAFKNIDYIIPLIRYYGQRESLKSAFSAAILGDNQKLVRINGFMGQKREWNNDLAVAKKNIENYTVEIDKNTLNEFSQFLENAKFNKIRVVLIYSPEYIQGQKFISNRQDVVNVFENLASKYNIPFLDYSGDNISFKRKNFYNSLHLNSDGAEIFTLKLIDDLRLILDQNN